MNFLDTNKIPDNWIKPGEFSSCSCGRFFPKLGGIWGCGGSNCFGELQDDLNKIIVKHCGKMRDEIAKYRIFKGLKPLFWMKQ